MPCDYESQYEENVEDEVALAEMGLSPEEIADLQARAVLAREQAKLASWNAGTTLEEQEAAMQAAVSAAVKEWHLEQHARLQRVMNQIDQLSKLHAPIEV